MLWKLFLKHFLYIKPKYHKNISITNKNVITLIMTKDI